MAKRIAEADADPRTKRQLIISRRDRQENIGFLERKKKSWREIFKINHVPRNCQRHGRPVGKPNRKMKTKTKYRKLRVGEIEQILGIGQPTLSQQLTVLRDEDLVETRREGKNIYYQVKSSKALAVIGTLYEQYCQA